MIVKVNPEICIGCGACIPVCPVDAITLANGKATIDQETCIQCLACLSECPVEAISSNV